MTDYYIDEKYLTIKITQYSDLVSLYITGMSLPSTLHTEPIVTACHLLCLWGSTISYKMWCLHRL
jgi:hypothetical protein